jgi:predicted RNA methylase
MTSNVLQIVENEQTSEFYPTPKELVAKMIEGINWDLIHTILEPSAGKGDILREVATGSKARRRYGEVDVDCIELDPNLRQILKYNFSEEREREISRRIRNIKESQIYNRDIGKYEELPFDKKVELRHLELEEKTFFNKGIHIVHDDFLTYTPLKKYDLIIMNPPFSNGDKHLLKALKMQEKGGSVICLLNAETIRNPYTETRKELVKQLEKHNATIEYIDNAFASAERKTGVEIAMIKVAIEQVQEESEIYERFKKAEKMEDFQPEVTDLELTDYIKAAVVRFNVEVKAGLELIRQYRALCPYMLNSFDEADKYKKPILRLTDTNDRSYDSVSVNEYLKKTRLKYWVALLQNPKFIGKLTSKLQSEYLDSVEKLKDYDFTEYNIRTLSVEMNAQIKKGVEDEIIAMFDRLTEEHSWYPECAKNRHYFDGWKTNKAHFIGKKVIIPCYGIFDSWDGKPRTYNARKALEDIERILNFLDGGMTRDIDFWHSLENCFNQGITKNINLKYFKATFYKKGTVHLEFTCPELIKRFNIYAAQQKKWLPPNYGKTRYTDMTDQEKAVIDSFQGEKDYNEVMASAGYYLKPVTNEQMLLLE